MDCERCITSKMDPARVRRFSSGLVTTGYLLWIPAAVILALGTLTSLVAFPRALVDPAREARARALTVDGLKNIGGLPAAVMTQFEATGQIDPASIDRLPHEQQLQLEVVMRGYRTALGSAADPVTSALGGLSRPLAYLLIPFGAAGWILTLRKTVWHCPRCGHNTEPA